MKKELKLLKYFVPVSIVLAVIPVFARLGKPLPGYESYYFIMKFSFLPEPALRFLPLMFALLSLALFYILLKEYGFEEKLCLYSVILMAVSTPFMYLSTFFTDNIFLMPVTLLALYLYTKKQKIYFALSIVLFLSTLLFSIYSLVAVTLLLAYSLTKKKRVNSSIVLSFILILLTLVLLPREFFIVSGYFLQHLVFEFGSPVGISASSIILSAFGFICLWKYKYRLIYVYLAIIALAVLSKFFFFMPIYLNLFAVLFSAYALSYLVNLKWEIGALKAVTIITILCTLLFASVAYLFFVKDMQPDWNVENSLLALREKPNGVVFSHPSKGLWIEYYAGKPVFSDILTLDSRQANISENLYYSRDFRNSTLLLNQTNIKYIWIDKDMKEGLVWTKPEQGLLFLFVDENLFKKIYSDREIEVWEYLPSK